MSSAAQIAANQTNAQFSTGPRTEAGKAISSKNAVKTGLTGRTVLLPGDDAEQYTKLVNSCFNEFKPVGDEETALVQSLADTKWRLWRIPALEAGIYALGRMELKDLFPEETDQAVRQQLIQAKIFLTYQRQLNNLSIQESRLRRQEEKDHKRLQELQAERSRSAGFSLPPKAGNARLQPSNNHFGFVFSDQPIKPGSPTKPADSHSLKADR